MPASEFGLTVESPRESVRAVRVSGELDLATADNLETAMRELAQDAPAAIIDLSGCEFVDSTGLRAILVGARHFTAELGNGSAGDSRVAIASPAPTVLRVLEISGVGEGVPIFGSREEAVEAVATASV